MTAVHSNGVADARPKLAFGPKRLAGLVGFAALIAALCWACIELPRDLGRISPIWPASAVSLTVLLSTGRRWWPMWLAAAGVGNLAASLAVGDSLPLALAFAACNLVGVVITAGALDRIVGPKLDPGRIADLLKLTLVGGIISPLIAASLSAVVIGQFEPGDMPARIAAWAMADGLGVIILTPLLLTLRDQRQHMAATPLTPIRLATLAGLATMTAMVFLMHDPLAFLIPPAMLLVVFQLELLGAAWGLTIVIAIAVGFSAAGLGPAGIEGAHIANRALVVQLFLAAVTLTSFPTAAVLAQRRKLQGEVADAAALTEEALHRARMAEDVAGVGYWRRPLGGEELIWSDAMFEIYGRDQAQGIAASQAMPLIHDDDRQMVIDLRNQVVAQGGDAHHYQYRLVRPTGEVRYVMARAASERDASGAVTALYGAIIDITELKLAEAELRAAREAAEAAATVKGEFLANMSHELRTPLTSVLGFTRLALEQPDLTDTSRGYIAKASNAGAALLSTVNDILDFSKLESGRLQIRLAPADPAAVCSETLELFSESADAKGLTLRFESTGLPESLAIDPDRLRQVLLNLIGNAVKFSETGEVVLAADWSPDDQRLALSVTDQGPGIAKAQQPLLFRRFSQVDGSSTRRHGGTGLGLAICMGIVEAMGGAIGVESEQGQGARFFFDIPAALAVTPDVDEAEATYLFAPGVRILVTDDHPANRELVRAVLVPFGAQVSEATDGAEAVILAGAEQFDLILMDLRMPVLDGMGAMQAIRSGGGHNAATPILAFSAGADAPTAQARRQAGFTGDLSKPVMPADLLAAVARYARAEAPAAAGKTATASR
jgi:PAS domain S-box-containing protein